MTAKISIERMSTPPVQPIPHTNNYRVIAPWGIVPAGFITNGASIPRILWTITGGPFHPRRMGAATLHDYRYQHPDGTRASIDREFHENLCRDGTHAWLAWAMYKVVRWCGEYCFNKHNQ